MRSAQFELQAVLIRFPFWAGLALSLDIFTDSSSGFCHPSRASTRRSEAFRLCVRDTDVPQVRFKVLVNSA